MTVLSRKLWLRRSSAADKFWLPTKESSPARPGLNRACVQYALDDAGEIT